MPELTPLFYADILGGILCGIISRDLLLSAPRTLRLTGSCANKRNENLTINSVGANVDFKAVSGAPNAQGNTAGGLFIFWRNSDAAIRAERAYDFLVLILPLDIAIATCGRERLDFGDANLFNLSQLKPLVV